MLGWETHAFSGPCTTSTAFSRSTHSRAPAALGCCAASHSGSRHVDWRSGRTQAASSLYIRVQHVRHVPEGAAASAAGVRAVPITHDAGAASATPPVARAAARAWGLPLADCAELVHDGSAQHLGCICKGRSAKWLAHPRRAHTGLELPLARRKSAGRRRTRHQCLPACRDIRFFRVGGRFRECISAQHCKALVARVASFLWARLCQGCSSCALHVHGSPEVAGSVGADPVGHLCRLGAQVRANG